MILIGIQASGKTTFYRERFFDTHVRISMDLLRTRRREALLLQACLQGGQRFVIDNTNVTRADRARYLEPARQFRFRAVGYFFEPDSRGAFARNRQRTGTSHVHPAGLFGTLKRLERPSLAEGFSALYRVTIPEPGAFAVEEWGGEPAPAG